MAGLNKTERRAKELYLEARATGNHNEWSDLTPEEKALWASKATSDMESPPVQTSAAGITHWPPGDYIIKPDPDFSDSMNISGNTFEGPVHDLIRDPLAAYRQAQGSVKIECPAPDRYVITGFRAASVFIPQVGTLAAPDQIDLPLNDDTAPAVQAALDDYNARKGVPRA